MKKILLIIIGTLLIILGIIGFNYYNKYDNNNQIEQDPSEIIIANENYEIDLIKSVNENSNDNYLISPYSIKIALNILKDGAKENSKKEIENLIGSKYNKIETAKNRVSVANALFIKDKYKNYIENDYYKKVKNYNSEILYDKYETPDVINNWVNEKTYKMIPKILDRMNEEFVIGIANALAIDVKWLNEFECHSTREDEFIKSDNSKINVEMMHQKYEYNIEYFINDDMKGVIIPYRTYDKEGNESKEGITLEFIGILPNQSLNDFIKNLNLEKLKEIDTLKKEIDSEKEELYWKHINEIEDFFDLYTKISDDPDVFAYMIKASYEFQKSNGLIKLLQTKSLTEEENKHLLEIAPVHKEDLDYYNTSITLERLIKNYKAQIKYYANNEEENPEEKASFNIYNFIKQLSLIDRNNFTTLVKELIKNDYIVSKTHGIENDYLNLYDDLNVGDLIQKMLDDQRVLKNILSHLNEYYNDTIDEIEEDYILKKMN